jgi:hypothetical protein
VSHTLPDLVSLGRACEGGWAEYGQHVVNVATTRLGIGVPGLLCHMATMAFAVWLLLWLSEHVPAL